MRGIFITAARNELDNENQQPESFKEVKSAQTEQENKTNDGYWFCCSSCFRWLRFLEQSRECCRIYDRKSRARQLAQYGHGDRCTTSRYNGTGWKSGVGDYFRYLCRLQFAG